MSLRVYRRQPVGRRARLTLPATMLSQSEAVALGGSLTFDGYQARALATDQYPSAPLPQAMYGLLSAVGKLAEEVRAPHHGRGMERLGDVLWYVAKLSNHFDTTLSEIASQNLTKTAERWGLPQPDDSQLHLFGTGADDFYDARFPPHEQLPRRFQFEFRERAYGEKRKLVISWNGVQVGDALSDNAREDDGYRFHDALHLAYAAVLGWSPVIRALLKRKRKDDAIVDEVEDGARATDTEESLTRLIFEHARQHSLFRQARSVDTRLLETLKLLTRGLEVKDRSEHDWEDAILQGYAILRKLRARRGGVVAVDLVRRRLSYRTLADRPRPASSG